MTLEEAIANIKRLHAEARDKSDYNTAPPGGDSLVVIINAARKYALEDVLALLEKVEA